jgi:hypothetical protein
MEDEELEELLDERNWSLFDGQPFSMEPMLG